MSFISLLVDKLHTLDKMYAEREKDKKLFAKRYPQVEELFKLVEE